jgi:hypothetical protein
VSPAQRVQGAKVFKNWHSVSFVMNLIGLGGLTIFAWRVVQPANGPRFIAANKFRG